jgi:phosphate acyltransferase
LSRRGPRPTPEELAHLPVAVDAMGGDKAPSDIVEGARRAAERGIGIVLVGPPEQVGETHGLELVACSEVIGMDEDPAGGVRRKKDSSLVRAAELVRDGKACAMVSAGNTGATMASALLRMGRLPGVQRPCIATPLPRLGRTPAVLVDAGANAECTPGMLVQFAQMGAAYVSARFGTEAPSVGLLSIGEEPTKGTATIIEAHRLMAADPQVNFYGNVEGRDLARHSVDVIVSDGFAGNVALKVFEGTAKTIVSEIRNAVLGSLRAKIGAAIMAKDLRRIGEALDPEQYGGAYLLGLRHPMVVGHGSSHARGVANGIRTASRGVTSELLPTIARRLAADEGRAEPAATGGS